MLAAYQLNPAGSIEMSHFQESDEDRLIRRAELRALVPVSNMTIWRWEKNNGFPRRIHLSPQIVGWRYSKVIQWLRSKELEISNDA
jgi:prophage regulatory protein